MKDFKMDSLVNAEEFWKDFSSSSEFVKITFGRFNERTSEGFHASFTMKSLGSFLKETSLAICFNQVGYKRFLQLPYNKK